MKQENKDGLKKIAIGFGAVIGAIVLFSLPQPAQGMGSGTEFVSELLDNTSNNLEMIGCVSSLGEDCD